MNERPVILKKIFFIIPTLPGGGAERVMLHILKHIDRNRFEPLLVLFEKKGDLLFDLPSKITVKVLKSKKSIYGFKWLVFINLARLLKLEKPDVAVSFMPYTNLITLLAKFLSRVRSAVVVSERCTLSISYEGWMDKLLRKLTIRFFYPKANRIIVNSKNMGIELQQMFNIPLSKIAVIYNPIDIQKVNQLSNENINHFWYEENVPIIIAVGRITPQKGILYLVKTLPLLASEGIECRLAILGKGAEEEKLKRLAKDLRIEDRVAFFGFQKNPYKYLAQSTLFVLSSLYEGFPNALLEAMALGVPSVATRCPTGPEEIITDGVDGILASPADERSLAEAIKRLLQDKGLRKKLAEGGKKRIKEFRVEKILKQYEDVIEKVCVSCAKDKGSEY